MDEVEQCPLCGEVMPLSILLEHANQCTRQTQQQHQLGGAHMDEDYALALQLQSEFDQQQRSPQPTG